MGVFAGNSKTAKAGLLCAASAGAVAVVAVGALAASRIRTLSSLKKLSSFVGPYNLYESTVSYRYDLVPLSRQGLKTTKPISTRCANRYSPAFP